MHLLVPTGFQTMVAKGLPLLRPQPAFVSYTLINAIIIVLLESRRPKRYLTTVKRKTWA
jgi:hypothetical protein